MPIQKILLAEDEPIIAMDLRMVLESMNFQVIQTSQLNDVLPICAHHFPNFAILNFHYSNQMVPFSIARQLRIHFGISTLIITGARPKDIFGAKDFYAGHDILFKPFTRQQLKNTLANFGAK